jgi:hypothetical protein
MSMRRNEGGLECLVGVCVDRQAQPEHQKDRSGREPEGSSFGGQSVEHDLIP